MRAFLQTSLWLLSAYAKQHALYCSPASFSAPPLTHPLCVQEILAAINLLVVRIADPTAAAAILPTLFEVLRHTSLDDLDDRSRYEAITAMGRMGSMEASPVAREAFVALGICMCDPQKANRRAACLQMAAIAVEDDRVACQLFSKAALSSQLDDFGQGASAPFVNRQSPVQLPWEFCGSFVIALEDEYVAVRSAAIEAIRCQALRLRTFAEAAVPFLIDCMEDENASIQREALNALRAVFQKHAIALSLGQIESLLSHMDDSNEASRAATQRLLASATLADDPEMLVRIVKSTPIAMQKYPGDVPKVLGVIAQLAAKNWPLVVRSVEQLVRVEKYFAMEEGRLDDATYLVKLVALLVALHASSQASFDLWMPPYIYKHYHYILLAFPHCVPSFLGHPLQDRFYAPSPIPAGPQSVQAPPGESCSDSLFDLLVQRANCLIGDFVRARSDGGPADEPLRRAVGTLRGNLAHLRRGAKESSPAPVRSYSILLESLLECLLDETAWGTIVGLSLAFVNVPSRLQRRLALLQERLMGNAADKAMAATSEEEPLDFVPSRQHVRAMQLITSKITLGGTSDDGATQQRPGQVVVTCSRRLPYFLSTSCMLSSPLPHGIDVTAIGTLSNGTVLECPLIERPASALALQRDGDPEAHPSPLLPGEERLSASTYCGRLFIPSNDERILSPQERQLVMVQGEAINAYRMTVVVQLRCSSGDSARVVTLPLHQEAGTPAEVYIKIAA